MKFFFVFCMMIVDLSPAAPGCFFSWTEPGKHSPPVVQTAPGATAAADDFLITDAQWTGIGQSQGIGLLDDEYITSMMMGAGNLLYVGGNFSIAGGTRVDNIALWDGNRWTSIKNAANPGMVLAFASDSKGNVYVAGWFNADSSLHARNIARWDGASWSALGKGINGNVFGLKVDNNDNLYAYGEFDTAGAVVAHNIARWDGTAWSALGSGTSAKILTCACDGSGNLYAGGYFEKAGSIEVNYVAKWDGETWNALAGGVIQIEYERSVIPVLALALDGKGDLYVGGDFDSVGTIAASNIARWNGSEWSALGNGVRPASLGSVASLVFDGKGMLYAGGNFDSAGSVPARNIARWDGNEWSALGSGTNGRIIAVSAGNTGNVFACGLFSTAGECSADNIAQWDGQAWLSLAAADGMGLNEHVSALTADNNGIVYAGGEFTTAGVKTVNHCARWDGTVWAPLDGGQPGDVLALSADTTGNLYAINYSLSQRYTVARWNGIVWNTIGNSTDPSVAACVVDVKGTLFAGGYFSMIGGVSSRNIAQWDGAAWGPFGGGVNHTVRALLFNHDTLYIGGNFDTAGTTSAHRIARWDGSTWCALGSGFNGHVNALAIDKSGNLYAGGDFDSAGSVTAHNIARWNGAVWDPLGEGINGFISSCAVDEDGCLYCGGAFDSAGAGVARNIAKWNGTAWSSMGSGTDGAVKALSIDHKGRLYVGGEFLVAGGEVSPGFAICAVNASGIKRTVRRSSFPAVMHFDHDGDIYIELQGAATVDYAMYSIDGRIVYAAAAVLPAGNHCFRPAASALPSGLYVMRVKVGKRTFERRIMVAK